VQFYTAHLFELPLDMSSSFLALSRASSVESQMTGHRILSFLLALYFETVSASSSEAVEAR
jgi:hypothetical protein